MNRPYDAQGFLARSGVGAEVAVPANTASRGFRSVHYGVVYTGIEQLEITGTSFTDYLVGCAQANILCGWGSDRPHASYLPTILELQAFWSD